ncbi:LysR family transcriptional regulator [Desulfoluna butyratoxydans]|uniref:Transcription regulator hth lysr n=1 Tax=Desulfoluna butyratoxydans TaxID=231438 RepID=A0A4U8YLL3_9BACT|nr:LysR family transcriptional regulator [Desulfoluna butyratoxydans]VFQ44591.1 transcription regulator hth lysr [Desulfoluna butyratoxydans]
METNEQIFLRVVEAGSLKAAAEHLGADPSSVSRKVAALEARLGVKLLQRSTRRSIPTDAGKRYYEGMRRLVDEQAALEACVAHEKDVPRGLLRVTAPNNIGDVHVAPVLTGMVDMYPDLKVELILTSEIQDMGEKGIDVSICIGNLPDSNLICRKLIDLPVLLIASKAYLEKRGTPRKPSDLPGHDFLFFNRMQRDTPLEFTGPNGPEKVKVSSKFIVNSASVIRKLNRAGFGISLGNPRAFKGLLDSGELVQLLPEYTLEPYPLYATYVSTAFVPAKIRRFVDLMAAYSAEELTGWGMLET